MTFNEWRHRATNYDNRMSGARTLEQKRAIMEQTALAAMQQAVASKDKALAISVMEWARSKRIVDLY